MLRNREELVRRLKVKPVARAVRWYDPGVLVRVGIRDTIAAVFGEYADQRLMQAATDRVEPASLRTRYDYSDPQGRTWNKGIPHQKDTYWVDYIADVGDGFGPTYGMATLLAEKKLSLTNYHAEELPAGQILILGGDQCYPQATHDEYDERFVLPFASAFPPLNDPKDERKLFALPGNHDWYDGLAAFDSLFCQNRDHLLGKEHGRRIGGWRCVQHRSYWAIRLPHNWWLWGVDIQFSKHLDAAQENYFRTIVEQMEGDHNIVLCIAEPHWLNAEFEGIDTVDSLHTIVRISQRRSKDPKKKRNVRINAVLAGDWHHYSHYRLDELYDPEAKIRAAPPKRSRTSPRAETQEATLKDQQVHLITAGGGGAFLHSTTDLRKQVKVSWGVRPENMPDSVSSDPAATPSQAGVEDEKQRRQRARRFTGIANMIACYPSRGLSAALSLKNLAFPLRNWRFSLVIGALYWIMTWQYHVVAKTADDLGPLYNQIKAVDYETINSVSNQMLAALPNFAAENILYCVMLLGLWAGLVSYVSVSEKRKPLFKFLVRASVGSLHALAHLKAMFMLFLLCIAFNKEFFDTGPNVGALYPLEVIPLGALVGGFIFGAYWVITGLLARMHTGDSFGALGIRNYKNFVRMKFEKNKLTIYPIGVEKLPSTKSFAKLCRKLIETSPANSTEERKPLLQITLPRAELIPDSEKNVQPIVIWRDKAQHVAPANTLQAAE
jgi:hypothetical protein